MELVYRIREERLDRHGRATITADLHWAGNNRLQLSTGVKVTPANWQPTKKNQVNTRETNAIGKNLDLTRFASKLTKVFTDAASADRRESEVREAEVRAAVSPTPAAAEPAPVELAPTEHTLAALHLKWQQENAGLGQKPLRRYTQVVNHLEAFRPNLQLGQLTRKLVADYQAYTQQQGVADSTFRNHVKFLREAFRTAGLHPPTWLKHKTPDSRPLSLTADEFRRLLTHAFPADQRSLAEERDAWVMQTLLLLRDSDLRRLRPGYVKEMPLLVGQPPVLVAGMPQQKTNEELAMPFTPLAAELWQRYAGRLPVVAQQNRNSRMKDMAAAVGLTREVVKVRWVGGQMQETVLPLCQALTSHAARHTGADLLLVGSGGDRNLVEIALGHVNYVYGHDSVFRYGPQLLAAWASVLGDIGTVGSGEICQRFSPDSTPDGTTLAA